MDTSSAGAGCPNQVSKKTVDRENGVLASQTERVDVVHFGRYRHLSVEPGGGGAVACRGVARRGRPHQIGTAQEGFAVKYVEARHSGHGVPRCEVCLPSAEAPPHSLGA